MNNQERQALIEWLQGEKSVSYQQNVKFIRLAREIALAALTENWQELASKWKEEAIRAHEEADDLHEKLKELAKQEQKQKPIYQFIMNRPDIDGYIEWVDCNKNYFDSCGDDIRRIVYAAPPAPFVVKAPEFKVHAQHPTMAAGMRDNDWKEAIRAAGGEVNSD